MLLQADRYWPDLVRAPRAPRSPRRPALQGRAPPAYEHRAECIQVLRRRLPHAHAMPSGASACRRSKGVWAPLQTATRAARRPAGRSPTATSSRSPTSSGTEFDARRRTRCSSTRRRRAVAPRARARRAHRRGAPRARAHLRRDHRAQGEREPCCERLLDAIDFFRDDAVVADPTRTSSTCGPSARSSASRTTTS